jgi:hypothetical protein
MKEIRFNPILALFVLNIASCSSSKEDPIEKLVLNFPKTVTSSDWESWAKFLSPNEPEVTFLTPEQNVKLVSGMMLALEDSVTLHHVPEKDKRTPTSLKVHYELHRNGNPYSEVEIKVVKNEKGNFQVTAQQFCAPFIAGIEKDMKKRAALLAKEIPGTGRKYIGREGRILTPQRLQMAAAGLIPYEQVGLKEIPAGL